MEQDKSRTWRDEQEQQKIETFVEDVKRKEEKHTRMKRGMGLMKWMNNKEKQEFWFKKNHQTERIVSDSTIHTPQNTKTSNPNKTPTKRTE